MEDIQFGNMYFKNSYFDFDFSLGHLQNCLSRTADDNLVTDAGDESIASTVLCRTSVWKKRSDPVR